MSPAGVIFDLDGVLLDSAAFHLRSWQALMAEEGQPYTEAQFWSTFGQTNAAILPRLLGRPVEGREMERLSERKEALFREAARGQIALFAGVPEMLRRLRGAGLRLALGTSAPRSNAEFFFRELNLKEYLKAYVCMQDVRRGKPDPEVFLLAARRLETPPERCVVIEDALAGLAAGRAAGMRCVAVATTHTAEELRAEGRPDLILPTAAALTAGQVRELLGEATPAAAGPSPAGCGSSR